MAKGLKIAAVLPRYKRSIGGGAETLVSSILWEIERRGEICGKKVSLIEIWTTCAEDHRTWENVYPEGLSYDNEIVVRRFPVDSRDVSVFLENEFTMASGHELSIDSQLSWIKNSVNSTNLYQWINSNYNDFDFVIYAPYLFATTFWGSLISSSKSVLFPCLHDESYAYQDIFKYMFEKAGLVCFNASAEKDLAHNIYGKDLFNEKSAVVGMGFDDYQGFFDKEPKVSSSSNYILYSGRKEEGKNLGLVIKFFEQYRKITGDKELEFRIIGSGKIEFLNQLPEGVHDLGFVSEEEKVKIFSNALALVQPSVNESFSIVLMESWIQKTPVIVNQRCDVTSEHVTESNGGFTFSDEKTFIDAIQLLKSDTKKSKEMGMNGYNYVRNKYNWDAVIERFFDGLSNSILNG